jgi:hydrogenase-4 component H
MKLGAMLPEILRHLFKKPATVFYPFEPVPAAKNYRGKPVMDPMKCIGCQRCVKDCPSEAIEINKAYEVTSPEGKPIRKFAMTLYIDRCTHCGQCAETCPVKAIHIDEDYNHPVYDRAQLVVMYKPELPKA